MPFGQLVNFVVGDLDQFWRQNLRSLGRSYTSPRSVISYTRPLNTACGPTYKNNAAYCVLSHSIYYDSSFLRDIYDDEGDFAVVTVLAHEWGHLAQANMGITLDPRYFTIQKELQADCFAGAYARAAGQRGMLEDGDLREGVTNLFRSGDRAGTPWFDRDAHGTPQQRASAFIIGLAHGFRRCS